MISSLDSGYLHPISESEEEKTSLRRTVTQRNLHSLADDDFWEKTDDASEEGKIQGSDQLQHPGDGARRSSTETGCRCVDEPSEEVWTSKSESSKRSLKKS